MSKVFVFEWSLPPIKVIAENFKEAKKLAADQQEQYSSANDGSELLVNGSLQFVEEFECSHKKTRTSVHHVSRSKHPMNGPSTMQNIKITYVSCKNCPHCIETEEDE